MEVFRIALTTYCKELTGRGAELYGGRWNKMGIPAIYSSSNRALCALEILANLSVIPNGVSYSLVTITIPDNDSYPILLPQKLHKNWNDIGGKQQCVEIGTEWIKNRSSLAMFVPSCLVIEDFNILINPMHPDASKISIKQIREFAFDPRFSKND